MKRMRRAVQQPMELVCSGLSRQLRSDQIIEYLEAPADVFREQEILRLVFASQVAVVLHLIVEIEHD